MSSQCAPNFSDPLSVKNVFRTFQDGTYKEMFCIDPNPANKEFVKNNMRQQMCGDPNAVVAYDLVTGAGDCKPCQTDILSYDIQGNLVRRKYL